MTDSAEILTKMIERREPDNGLTRLDKIARWARTVKRLEPEQALHRLQLRSRREIDKLGNFHLPRVRLRRAPAPELLALPLVSYEAKLHSPEEAETLTSGRAKVLGVEVSTRDGQIDWLDPNLPRLALMTLHYADWLWAFMAHSDHSWAATATRDVLNDWASSVPPGMWIPWHPYAVATRGWNLAQTIPALIDNPDCDLRKMVWFHGDQLFRNLEHDVRGNHLVRDYRGLIALGLCVDEPTWITTGVDGLCSCIAEQVLADGGHYERSPYYHVQVLTDLAEVAELLRQCGHRVPDVIDAAVTSMSQWLTTVCPNDRDLPVFNDGVRRNPRSAITNLRQLTTALGSGATPKLQVDDKHGRLEPRCHIGPSGYAIAKSGPWWLAMDIGDPAPRTLPSHGHCSLLSLELFFNDQPVLVNTGSSTYDDANLRFIERGTLGHNTVRIDGAEQSEIWDRFRIGRQARPTEKATSMDPHAKKATISGSHDGYDHLPGQPKHIRRVEISNELVTIFDSFRGEGDHEIEGRWRLNPSLHTTVIQNGVLVDSPPSEPPLKQDHQLRIEVNGPVELTVINNTDDDADYVALDYGLIQRTSSLRWRARLRFPAEVVTTLTVSEAADVQAQSGSN